MTKNFFAFCAIMRKIGRSELQSPCNLVCRLLLEKKKYTKLQPHPSSPCRMLFPPTPPPSPFPSPRTETLSYLTRLHDAAYVYLLQAHQSMHASIRT